MGYSVLQIPDAVFIKPHSIGRSTVGLSAQLPLPRHTRRVTLFFRQLGEGGTSLSCVSTERDSHFRGGPVSLLSVA